MGGKIHYIVPLSSTHPRNSVEVKFRLSLKALKSGTIKNTSPAYSKDFRRIAKMHKEEYCLNTTNIFKHSLQNTAEFDGVFKKNHPSNHQLLS